MPMRASERVLEAIPKQGPGRKTGERIPQIRCRRLGGDRVVLCRRVAGCFDGGLRYVG
jgi:hypothetical protein